MNCQAYSPQMLPTEYQMLEPAQSWSRSQFVLVPHYNPFPDQNGNFHPITPQSFAPVYGDQHPSQIYNGNNNERPVRLAAAAAATKEARKNRMARQRRGSLHHNRQHPHQDQPNKIDSPEQSEGQFIVKNCTNKINGPTNCVNWRNWRPATEAPIKQPPAESQPQQQECQMSDRTSLQAQSKQQLAQSERGQLQKPVVTLHLIVNFQAVELIVLQLSLLIMLSWFLCRNLKVRTT